MQLYGVIGHPILHSRSPNLFNPIFAADNRAAVYLRLAARRIEQALALAQSLGLAGLNITSPFKEAAAENAASLTELASRLGAVNVLIRQADGSWRGDNTDVVGVSEALRAGDFSPLGKRCLILGAGGAAKAALIALQLGLAARVTVINRTEDKARAIAAAFGVQARPWADLESALGETDLLVSCLPPGVDAAPAEWLPPALTVLEANYHQPLLLPKARARGRRAIDGRQWLIRQAEGAYRSFFGAPPPANAMAAAWVIQPPAKRAIALIGFMGTGKTTIGRSLAARLNAPFFDTDQRIVERAGRDIPAIFATQGEAEFRRIETEILRDLPLADRPVIACGGGILLDPANRQWLQREAVCLWCWSSIPAVLRRATDSSRPLLAVANPEQVATTLLAGRMPLYAAAADLVLDTENQTPENAVDLLADEIHFSRLR